MVSSSISDWFSLASAGQLSMSPLTASPSISLSASFGNASALSPTPSESVSVVSDESFGNASSPFKTESPSISESQTSPMVSSSVSN